MRFALGALAATCLLASGCSASHVDNPTVVVPPTLSYTSTAGVPAMPAPCTVLTAAQIQSALGGTVAAGVASTATVPGCTWTVHGSRAGGDGSLALSYPAAQSRAGFLAAKAAVPGAEAVPELGDAAFFDPGTSALTVLFGAHQFVVTASFGHRASDGAVQADLIPLAEQVETHL